MANSFFVEVGKRVTDEIGPVDAECFDDLKNINCSLRKFSNPSDYTLKKIIDQQESDRCTGQDRITDRTLKRNIPSLCLFCSTSVSPIPKIFPHIHESRCCADS